MFQQSWSASFFLEIIVSVWCTAHVRVWMDDLEKQTLHWIWTTSWIGLSLKLCDVIWPLSQEVEISLVESTWAICEPSRVREGLSALQASTNLSQCSDDDWKWQSEKLALKCASVLRKGWAGSAAVALRDRPRSTQFNLMFNSNFSQLRRTEKFGCKVLCLERLNLRFLCNEEQW